MMWWIYLILFGVSYIIFEWRARRQVADEARRMEEKWRAERLVMTHIRSGAHSLLSFHKCPFVNNLNTFTCPCYEQRTCFSNQTLLTFLFLPFF
jgi:hypothetical protein